MSRKLKFTLQIILFISITLTGYLLFRNIMQPIRFQKLYNQRFEIVKQRLIEIRDAQIAYKSNYGFYASDFDILVNFIKKDSIKVVRSNGSVPDSIAIQFKNKKEAEVKALEYGIITRDTLKISVLDSLFDSSYNVDDIKFVPFSNSEEIFEMTATSISTMSGINVPVFEVKADNYMFTSGLNKQEVANLNKLLEEQGKYAGIKVGSITEVTNNSGNWGN